MSTPHTPPVSAKGRHLRWVLLGAGLVVLNLLTFWPGLRGEFVWDDDLLLLDHPNYRRPELILASLRSLFIISPSYFRPLGYFSFFVDYSLFGPEPLGYHLENLLLHCASTLLVVRLLASLSAPFLAAALGAVLFAVHPSRVEGVIFISSRFDLLATLFVLCALLLHRASLSRRSWWLRGGAACLYGLALGSKEMAVTMPAVAWYADRYLWPGVADRGCHRASSRLQSWRGFLPYAAALGAYLILRMAVLGSVVVSRDLAIPIRGAVEHLLLVGRTIFGYVVFVAVPFMPNPVHYLPSVSFLDPQAWSGLMLVLVAIWALLTGHLRGAARDGVVLFLLLLVPVMNMVPIRLAGPSFMAERFLYLPLLAVVLALRHVPVRTGLVKAVILLLAAAWIAVSHHASAQWQSDRTLFAWVARRTPQSALGFTNLALEETRGGSPDRAVGLSEQALARDRRNPDAWDNLGVAYYQLGRLAEAESCFVQALQLAPGHPLFSTNLAGTWRTMGKYPDALSLLARVIQNDSTTASAHLNVGLCYLRMDDPEKAVSPLRRAAILMEVDTTTWMTLAQALLLTHRKDEALAAIRSAVNRGLSEGDAGRQLAAWGREALEARRVGDAAELLWAAGTVLPTDPAVANDLGVSLRAYGRIAAAESCFARAVDLAPGLATAWANLGEAHALAGKDAAADSILSRAIATWPDLADPYRHLGRLRMAQGRHAHAAQLFHDYLLRAPNGVFAPEVRAYLNRE